MTSTNGGASGVGRWTAEIHDPGATIAIAEARGGSHPSTSLLVGSAGGFTYSPADNKFYAVLPGAGAMYTKHRATDDLAVLDDAPGDVIRYDPVANRVEYLASIPPLDPAGSGRVLNRYLTSPVVKADGKSLVLVAQAGGALNINPLPCSRTASTIRPAPVHLDLDPASPGYLRFRAVYDFAEYGRSMPYWLQLRFVDGKPVPVLINGSEAIFLRSNLQRLDSQLKLKNTVGRQFCLQPRVDSDWSQPWQMVGSPGLLEGSQLVDQMCLGRVRGPLLVVGFADLVSTAIPPTSPATRIPAWAAPSGGDDHEAISTCAIRSASSRCRGVDSATSSRGAATAGTRKRGPRRSSGGAFGRRRPAVLPRFTEYARQRRLGADRHRAQPIDRRGADHGDLRAGSPRVRGRDPGEIDQHLPRLDPGRDRSPARALRGGALQPRPEHAPSRTHRRSTCPRSPWSTWSTGAWTRVTCSSAPLPWAGPSRIRSRIGTS
jgi:hypothetical protein